MFRRFVSFVLLSCLLLTQSAAWGHCHDQSQALRHDLRVHFHTNAAADDCQTRHSHHDADEEGGEWQLGSHHSQSEPAHDATAVYLDRTDALLRGKAQCDRELPQADASFVVGWILPVLFENRSTSQFTDRQNKVLSCRACCPIYLRHLTILI